MENARGGGSGSDGIDTMGMGEQHQILHPDRKKMEKICRIAPGCYELRVACLATHLCTNSINFALLLLSLRGCRR